jgi:hypothetical protein
MQVISSITSVTQTSATGTLTWDNSAGPSDGETVTIGGITYTFKTTLTPTAGQVLLNGGGDAAMLNLIRAINHTGTAGTDYANLGVTTVANPQVTAASSVTAHAFAVTANAPGIYGQAIVTTETSAHLSWGAATLTGGNQVTIVGTTTLQTLSQPSQIQTIAEYTTNPNWSRGHRLTNGAHIVRRNGANFLGLITAAWSKVAVYLEPSLSWVPIVDTQPSPESCVHSSTAAIFTTVADVTETTLSYQWQYSTDGGTTWVNATGTINGTAYTNSTTAALTCTPTTTGQTGKLHRCAITNASGTTYTTSVALTIT